LGKRQTQQLGGLALADEILRQSMVNQLAQ
jgi:hypothetical protein